MQCLAESAVLFMDGLLTSKLLRVRVPALGSTWRTSDDGRFATTCLLNIGPHLRFRRRTASDGTGTLVGAAGA